ncbi:sulfotransferase family protein [Acuticoccus kandeliae]|uniref:sulfotransferase family protein n=1 Tax=Acuticoccus kandeliae TaxID=2073160 RepID=UPI000D3EDEF1|nr:sulfotransferase [Acuticoccus kandeliae]
MSQPKTILFVGGCPRSGTTALTRLLNCHPDILLGNERYYWPMDKHHATPDLFDRARFLEIREGDTHSGARDPYAGSDADQKFDGARYVGDKYPPIYRAYDFLAERFPDARVIAIVRNPFSVAESYEVRARNDGDDWRRDHAQGIRDWSASVVRTAKAVESGMKVTVVSYERLFAAGADISPLYAALGLDPAPAFPAADGILQHAQRVGAKPAPRNDTIRFEVALKAQFGPYRKLVTEHCIFG